MKTIKRLAGTGLVTIGLAFSIQTAIAQDVSDADVVSYKLGHDIGQRIKALGVDINDQAFLRGIRAAIEGADSSLTADQEQAAITQIQEAQQAQIENQRKELAAQAEKNLEEGKAFLEQNRTKEGVFVTESGLQYEIVEQGDGAKPLATDRVNVHYRGVLLNGTEFDSSYKRGEPISFALNGVIPGWTEGLQLMSIGSKYKFYIPADLAYGGRSQGAITPNSTLIFDVELLGIE